MKTPKTAKAAKGADQMNHEPPPLPPCDACLRRVLQMVEAGRPVDYAICDHADQGGKVSLILPIQTGRRVVSWHLCGPFTMAEATDQLGKMAIALAQRGLVKKDSAGDKLH